MVSIEIYCFKMFELGTKRLRYETSWVQDDKYVDEQLGSPLSNFQELVALHIQEVMEDQIVASLTRIQVYSQGKALHEQFV